MGFQCSEVYLGTTINDKDGRCVASSVSEHRCWDGKRFAEQRTYVNKPDDKGNLETVLLISRVEYLRERGSTNRRAS